MLPKTTIKVIPRSGSYVNGVWEPSSGESRDEPVVIQPASDTAMQREPTGRRHRVVYEVLGYGTLDDGAKSGQAEHVEFDGETFEVSAVRRSDAGVLPHFTANLLSIEDDGST